MKYIQCDLLEAPANIIVHQVNCMGAMGRGLALQIKQRYPSVYKHYKMACDKYRPEELLGKVQVIRISDTLSVVNLFGQLDYGTVARYTDYTAFREAVQKLNDRFRGETIAFPYKIGCGLAGGDWDTIQSIIAETMTDCEVLICRI